MTRRDFPTAAYGGQQRARPTPDQVEAQHLERHVAPRPSSKCPLCRAARRPAGHQVVLSGAEVDALEQFVRRVEASDPAVREFGGRVEMLTKFLRDLLGDK